VIRIYCTACDEEVVKGENLLELLRELEEIDWTENNHLNYLDQSLPRDFEIQKQTQNWEKVEVDVQ
jgi:hypothetical protein